MKQYFGVKVKVKAKQLAERREQFGLEDKLVITFDFQRENLKKKAVPCVHVVFKCCGFSVQQAARGHRAPPERDDGRRLRLGVRPGRGPEPPQGKGGTLRRGRRMRRQRVSRTQPRVERAVGRVRRAIRELDEGGGGEQQDRRRRRGRARHEQVLEVKCNKPNVAPNSSS